MRYIFVDVDHTLFHSAWRDHLAPNKSLDSVRTEETDWDKYTEAGLNDQPVEEMIDLCKWLWTTGYKLVILTAVNERYSEMMDKRLKAAGIDHLFFAVLMRPSDDRTPSAMLKPVMASTFLKVVEKNEQIKLKDHVAFVVEDRPDVCEAFKALGVSCLQVHAVQR